MRCISMSIVTIGVSLLLFAAGCRTTEAGPRGSAARQALDVLIEEGQASEMEARQYQYRCEVRDQMERDLPGRFARGGLDVRMIRQRSEHAAAAAGTHLLVVHYNSYNPGSTAARIVVGFGAGAASLDLSATLFDGNTQLLTWKDGCGTSGHWSRVVRKLNDNMAAKLRAFYASR